MSRTASVERKTKETSIALRLSVDGSGTADIATPVGFLSHMLETVAKHARIDLTVRAEGDTHIDAHHTVEDVGLAFGEALDQALGDRAGIERFGTSYVPLDEALVRSVVDLSGRPYIVFESPVDKALLLVTKDFPFALVEEFWKSAAFRGKFNLHVDVVRAKNGHHAAEAVFKSAARALRQAVAKTGTGVLSTKGTLTA
jgi:imidazoleglycerol-phosphate dehydratase